jgi:hypothetical protein
MLRVYIELLWPLSANIWDRQVEFTDTDDFYTESFVIYYQILYQTVLDITIYCFDLDLFCDYWITGQVFFWGLMQVLHIFSYSIVKVARSAIEENIYINRIKYLIYLFLCFRSVDLCVNYII